MNLPEGRAIADLSSLNEHKSGIVKLKDYDRFKPVLYTNLAIPSYMHAYSLAIEYMSNWYYSKFPKDYYKYKHINGRHVFDNYRAWNDQNIKREKPYCVITPEIDRDYDRENLDLYNAGANVFLRRSSLQNSFFKDYDKNIFLGIQLQEMKVNFNIRSRVTTRAEQEDLSKRIELMCRVGGTNTEFISADFHLPYQLISNIAKLAGFKVNENGYILHPFEVLNYLNSHSEIPFEYKMRYINQKEEFFLRAADVYAHLDIKDKLQLDNGNRKGMIDIDFGIDLTTVLRMAIPHFYVLYSEEELYYALKVETTTSADINIYTMSQFVIPNTDEHGWNRVIDTCYLLDLGEREFDISSMLVGTPTTNIARVINYNLDNFQSPKHFINIKLYKESAGSYVELPYDIDYKKMTITIRDTDSIKIKDDLIYIAIYLDEGYMNDTLNMLNKAYKSRMTRDPNSAIEHQENMKNVNVKRVVTEDK